LNKKFKQCQQRNFKSNHKINPSYTTMSYKERMQLRMLLKSRFNQVNDPILQRGDQYVKENNYQL